MQWLVALNRHIGHAVAWLTLLMVVNTVLVLIGRDVFGFGRIWLQELTSWMHATVFLLAAAYTMQHDEHVRVDVFYSKLGERGRAIVDLTGSLLLLLPFCTAILITSWDYVFGERGSWAIREASRQASGLPFPATSLLKTFMILMPVLILIQAVVIMIKSVLKILGRS